MKHYVEKTAQGGYRVTGSRVSLDSIVYAFREGRSPESIAQSFDTLSLEQVYGAIAFYLSCRAEIDGYLEQRKVAYEAARQAERAANPDFYRKLREAREKLLTPA